MNDAVTELVPVLDDVIGFMEEALQSKQADENRITSLTDALKKAKADQERVILEKVAAARASFLDESTMKEALTRLQTMGIITDRGNEKLASRFKGDPNAVFPIMVKIAENLLTAPGDGSGIDKEGKTESGSEADPDGWIDFAQGKPVKVKR
jgi:hypothetical protein